MFFTLTLSKFLQSDLKPIKEIDTKYLNDMKVAQMSRCLIVGVTGGLVCSAGKKCWKCSSCGRSRWWMYECVCSQVSEQWEEVCRKRGQFSQKQWVTQFICNVWFLLFSVVYIQIWLRSVRGLWVCSCHWSLLKTLNSSFLGTFSWFQINGRSAGGNMEKHTKDEIRRKSAKNHVGLSPWNKRPHTEGREGSALLPGCR